MHDCLGDALSLAEAGVPVFAVGEDRVPLRRGGFHIASCDAAQVRDQFRSRRAHMIAVPCGDPSGLSVLDCDIGESKPTSVPARTWLDRHGDRLPRTLTVVTQSGGLHFYFRHVDGLRRRIGALGPGIDILGTGGFTIVWRADRLLGAVRVPGWPGIAAWPAWLMAAEQPPSSMRPAAPPAARRSTILTYRDRRYAEAALRNATERVAGATRGTRNNTLNRETHSLMRLARDGLLDPQAIADAMFGAGTSAGLGQKETMATVASALRAGGI